MPVSTSRSRRSSCSSPCARLHTSGWYHGYADPAWYKGLVIGDLLGIRPGAARESVNRQLNAWQDEGPSWAPNGRVVMFTRQTPGGDGTSRLHSVDVTGRNMRPLDIEGAASDPDWGPLLP